MSGFFKDTSGLDNNEYGSTNNVAADFARRSAVNPAEFGQGSGGIFERLFGGKKVAPGPQPDSSAMATPTATSATPPSPSPAPASSPASPKPGPAISSAPGLIGRIVGSATAPPSYNADGKALVPGTPFTPEEFAQKVLASVPPPPPPPPTAANAPYQGIPQFTGPPPPRREEQSPYGNAKFGGAQFGGTQFGGAQFGASAPPAPQPMSSPQPQPVSGPPMGPPNMTEMTPMQRLEQMRRQPQMTMGLPAQPQGFFRGGALHMMRGGYPAHLMMGLPQRFAHGGDPAGQPHQGGKQGFVPPDGMGDGRSDHVDAKLSPGEFVMDAETVSLLGNGDNEAGARGLEKMRKDVRELKGKALAKGKFSPNAKSPAHYARVAAKGID